MPQEPKIRRAAVAGAFYPQNASQIRLVLSQYLSDARTKKQAPKAIVAPHAGYIYSGAVAATVYARLKNTRQKIERVVLLGPSHRVGFNGLAVTTADYYETPLGRVPIDKKACETITHFSQVGSLDEAHAEEHSLEVHIPFLQLLLKDFMLVPLVVGIAKPLEVSEVLETLWGGDETLIIISTDLSHHQDYETAKRRDAHTCEAIVNLKPQNIRDDDACGRYPLSGFLHLAKIKNLNAETVDLRNSGDTAGSKNSVVGYGAWAFE
ncbi:MAG: AmmeMemoRadiSam system protein B [Deltaproteobacteria bacterium]|nr:AmmeMemoRadiSam system protein B [Deltaproteobacteria bacterium]